MPACVFTWMGIYRDLLGSFWATKWSKNSKSVDFSLWIRIIQSGALTLCRNIFNGYLWWHTIGTDDVCIHFDLSWGLYWSVWGSAYNGSDKPLHHVTPWFSLKLFMCVTADWLNSSTRIYCIDCFWYSKFQTVISSATIDQNYAKNVNAEYPI